MLPRLGAAELCCAWLMQHGSTGPPRCLSSRVLHCSTVTSRKWSTTAFDTRKFQLNSSKTNKTDSITSARHYSIYDLCSNLHYKNNALKLLTVKKRTDTKFNVVLKGQFCNTHINCRYKIYHKGNNLVQNSVSFSPSLLKTHPTPQNILECSTLFRTETNPDVRLMKYQYHNKKGDYSCYPSINGLSSVLISGIHSTAVPFATDQPKIVDLNPDFDSSPTLSQRFVDGCPPSMKPYLQLLRIDRPIGKVLLVVV